MVTIIFNKFVLCFFTDHHLREQPAPFIQNSKSLPQLYPPSEFMNPYRYLHGPHSSSMGALTHPHHPGPMDLKSASSQMLPFSNGRIPSTTSIDLTVTTASPTTSTSMMTPSNGFPQSLPSHLPYIPKHWIWNRNIFYSPLASRNGELASNYFAYGNPNAFNSSDLSSPKSSTKTESLNSNSPIHITDGTSEDSLDNEDEKVPETKSGGKKRNPYSIEELLKKPEKRRKVDVKFDFKGNLATITKTPTVQEEKEDKKVSLEDSAEEVNENIEVV